MSRFEALLARSVPRLAPASSFQHLGSPAYEAGWRCTCKRRQDDCVAGVSKRNSMMKVRRMLAIGALGAWFSSPSFADEASVSATTAAPKMRVQAQFELLPMGSAKGHIADMATTTDLAVAYGITASFDYALTPYLSIGASPRLVFNLIADPANGDTADKALDVRACIRAHYPVLHGLELYASVAPGYTIVLSSTDGVNNATGFAIGGAAGLAYDLSPKMFVAGEVGYQRAFTSTTIEMFGPLVREDLDLSYLHVGIGAGTRF